LIWKSFYFYFKIILVLVVVAIALDFGYTTIYKQSKTEENRLCFNSTAWKYDVVILGSSRANNHFVSIYSKNKV
jgi:hypothetical protein